MRTPFIARCLAIAVVLTVSGCSKSTTPTPANNSSSTSAPSSSSQPNSSASNSQPAPAPVPAAPVAPPPVTIPSGTQLTIVLNDTIDSKIANDGDKFSATLAAPITVGGNIVLPVGTRASGTVVTAHSAGKLRATPCSRLRSTPCGSAAIPTQFKPANLKTQEKAAASVPPSAQAAAQLSARSSGAVAGGGKGAAIGALAGGGAGTAGAAFTGKKDITLPAETRLHFRLTAPVTVQVDQSAPPAAAPAQ